MQIVSNVIKMMLKIIIIVCLIIYLKLKPVETALLLKNDLSPRNGDNETRLIENIRSLYRSKRYLGLNSQYKINKRYQECVAPGDAPGHCKHLPFCSLNVVQLSGGSLNYLCVIEKMHVGVCCPDDVLLGSLTGSQIVMDLPAGGRDYDDEEDSSTSGCGVMSYTRTPTESNKGRSVEWPWLAALYRPIGAQLSFCGGAVITDRHILTAAHCVNLMEAKDIRVRLGEYDFRKVDETRARDFQVSEIVIHEEFEPTTYDNDIAIVTLNKSTTFDTYVWPICLPPIQGDYVNKTVVVAGWGQQHYAGPTSQLLMEVSIPVWEPERCKASYTQRITENHLCAAAYEGGKDACLGDSGGPLLYQLDNGRWVTIGIVSWGIGCGNKDQPGIYIRVDKYIPWIITNTITKTLVSLP